MHRQDFALSHEFLAEMLGASRSTVSEVAGKLQAAGLIRYSHGRVTVVDRKGLEAASCECYAAIRAHFDRLQQPTTLTSLLRYDAARTVGKPTDRDKCLMFATIVIAVLVRGVFVHDMGKRWWMENE